MSLYLQEKKSVLLKTFWKRLSPSDNDKGGRGNYMDIVDSVMDYPLKSHFSVQFRLYDIEILSILSYLRLN